MATVLMVEDNVTNRKLMRDILEIRFEKVLEVGSAEEASALLENTVPDLILMDLELPGMDGKTMIQQLKRDPSLNHIPIVAISAHAMQQSIDEVLALGCVDYVTKPIVEDPFVLAERLEQYAQINESK